MAIKTFRQVVAAMVQQVWQGSITTTTGGHTYAVTLTDDNGNTEVFTYTVTGSEGSTTAIAAAMVTQWNADPRNKIGRLTASSNANAFILTADVAGVPFAASTSGSGTWSGTGNTTTNVGNNDWNTARNWPADTLPTDYDDVVFGPGEIGALYGLDQSAAGAFDELRFEPGFTGDVGRFDLSQPHYLTLDPDSVVIRGASRRMLLDIGAANIPILVESQGLPSLPGGHAIYLLGSNISVLEVNQGHVGVAVHDGETATIATLLLGALTGPRSDANVTLGEGVSLTTLDQQAGLCTLNCGCTTAIVAAGAQLWTLGTGAIATLRVWGTAYPGAVGAITNLYANEGGTVDFTRDRSAKTVTNMRPANRSTIILHDDVTVTNWVMPSAPASVTIKWAA